MLQVLNNKFQKFIYKIEDVCSSENYKVAFFGSELNICFSANYDYAKYLDEYSMYDFDADEQFEIIVIAGAINLKQLAHIKEQVNKYNIKHVVYVTGSVFKKENKHLYNAVNNVEDHLNISFKYEQFPVRLDELTIKIRELRRGIHEPS